MFSLVRVKVGIIVSFWCVCFVFDGLLFLRAGLFAFLAANLLMRACFENIYNNINNW